MVKDNDFLYENLYKFRREKGYSQEELANKIGVSRQSVSKWETNEIKPSMENIILLCKALEKDISDLSRSMQDVSLLKTNVDEKKTETVNNVKKSGTFTKKFFMCILVLFILIEILNIIYKTIIIYKINSKAEKYEKINNFSYITKSYSVSGNSIINLVKEETYYKDGIFKRVCFNDNGEKENVIWIDYEKKIGYTYSYENNEKMEINLLNDVAVTNNRLYLLDKAEINTDSYIKNLFFLANPLVSIRIEDNNYFIKYNQNSNRIKEWIDKNTGLMVKRVIQNKSEEKIIEFQFTFNTTTDDKVKEESWQ